jgi:hypothetical protein
VKVPLFTESVENGETSRVAVRLADCFAALGHTGAVASRKGHIVAQYLRVLED